MESLTSFEISVGTSALIFVVSFIVFRVCAPRKENAIIFFPAKLLAGEEIPDDQRFSFKWFTDTWWKSEDEIVSFAGLDAMCYLKFLSACGWIMFCVSLYCTIVLVPLCFTATGYQDLEQLFVVSKVKNLTVTYIQLDYLSMSNIPEGSDLIWYFVIGGYWVALVTIACLYLTYRDIISLRVKFLSLKKPPLDLYSVLVRDVSISLFSNEVPDGLIDSEFGTRYGKAYDRALLVPKLTRVQHAYNQAVEAKARLQEAYNLLEWSKTPENPRGVRPVTFTIWSPLLYVDSIEYYTKEFRTRMHTLKEAQESATQFSGAAVAFFNDPMVASLAANAIPGINSALWTVSSAPEPEDVEWENVTLPLWNRTLRMIAVFIVTWMTVIFYLIPITFVAAFTTLDNLEIYLPFLSSIMTNATLKTVLEAYLPQLALLTFLAVLPSTLEFFTWFEGFPSKSHAVRAAAVKYYYFVVINVFLGYTVSGGVLGILATLAQPGTTVDSVMNLLGTSLPKQSSFFITYIAFKFLIMRGLELSGIVRYIMYRVNRFFMSKTEEGLRKSWFPGPLRYNNLVPNDLLIVTLGLCYAVISPMILPFAFTYFFVTWFVYKYQAMTVYYPEYDSRGQFWPHMHDRILFALLLSQVTFISYLTLKSFTGGIFVLIPLPIISIAYFQYSQARFHPTFTAQWAPGFAPKHPPPPIQDLVAAYTPDCLKKLTEDSPMMVRLPSFVTKNISNVKSMPRIVDEDTGELSTSRSDPAESA